MSSLTITRGLPGSGKTTWAKEQQASGFLRVNRDDIRRMLFGKPDYSSKQEKLVTQVQRDTIKAAFKAGFTDVIADDTNLPPKRVREWFRFARDNGAEFKVEEFEIDVEEACRRQQFRPSGEWVYGDVIRKMARSLKKGKLQPYDLSLDAVPPAGETYVPDTTKPKAIIVDIDGTVALMDGRSPYDLSLVHTDKPNEPVIWAVEAMDALGVEVIFLSGREDSSHKETAQWLSTHVWVDNYVGLFMRPTDDKRKDSIVKRELFDKYVRNQYNVLFVLDDRNQVVDMWRELGLTCLQVAPGDF